MIARLWLMTGCIALILPAALCAQPGGGGNFGGGGRGGFGGGGFGGFGGGGGGFSRGGFSGRGMGDPDQFFNMLSQGKDFIDLNSMDDRRRSGMERMLQRFNITAKDGKISREDFRAASEKMRSGMGGRPGRGGDGPPSTDSQAEAEFNKLDRDHDGQLSAEEMTGPFGESLLAERDKWDSNQDKFIDLAEFKSFYAARMQQQKNDRKDGSDRSARDDRNSRDKPDLDRRPVVVYRAGNMPKEVAALFAKYDTDQDAQISLYEWRMGGGDIEEFKKMDRSGDNLLTVEEALLYVRLEKMNSSVASSGDSGNKPGNGGPGAVNFNMGGGPAAFGDRQNGGRSPWGGGNWQGGGGNWPGAGGAWGANGFGGGGRNRNRGNNGGGGRNRGGDYGGGGE